MAMDRSLSEKILTTESDTPYSETPRANDAEDNPRKLGDVT